MNKEQEIAEKLQNHRVEKSEKEEQKEGVTKFTNEHELMPLEQNYQKHMTK